MKGQTYQTSNDLWLESIFSVIKPLFFLLLASSLSAQPYFQKKIGGMQLAEGLAVMPDGGMVLAGLKGNCIQIIRLEANGSPVWKRQLCPADPDADISIRALQLSSMPNNPGEFLLLFRKGAFTTAPYNLLNVIKFDATGDIKWETQLRPEKRYGPFTPGTHFAVSEVGDIWAAHGMGFTDSLPDFNQALVFKLGNTGQILLRRFFKTDTPATANGIVVKNKQEVFVYGSLDNAIADGFLLKINDLGDVVWAKRYAGLSFFRDGAVFSNGDLLLIGEHENAYAMARISAEGTVAWAAKFQDTISLFRCIVEANEEVVVAGRNPDGISMLFKIDAGSLSVSWAKKYEVCTRFHTTALAPLAGIGFVCAQSTISGLPVTRIFQGDQAGNLSASCAVQQTPPPILTEISTSTSPLQFTFSDGLIQPNEHIFLLEESSLDVQDCCPTELPEALTVLPDSICTNSPFSLKSLGNPCADEWSWTLSGASTKMHQGLEFQDITYEHAGEFPLMLIEKFGVCNDTFHGVLRVVTAPNLDIFAYSDTIICPDKPFLLFPDLSGVDSWVWNNGNLTPFQNLENPQAGFYGLVAQKGICTIADSVKIEIGNCGTTRVFAPNVFSPNGDGLNDHWQIFFQNGVVPLACQVFDRWGNLCFTSGKDEIPIWDGNFKGLPMLANVYVWHFRLLNPEGLEEQLEGEFLLLH
ncbi:MAG: T9SS type B sorting domain-containing protein [Saprospiraceae bacterium]